MSFRFFQLFLKVPIVLLAAIEGGLFFFAPYLASSILLGPEQLESPGGSGGLLPTALLYSVFCVASHFAFGLYTARQRAGTIGLLVRVAAGCLHGAALSALTYFFIPSIAIPREVLGLTALVAAAFSGVTRALFERIVDQDTFKSRVLVYGVAEDGTVYVGGTFTRMGPMTGGGVPVSADSGAPVATFAKVDGFVDAVVPDGGGGWYVGGQFTRVGGEPRDCLAHLLADGTVDPAWAPGARGTSPYDPGFTGWVKDLAFDGTTLFAAGLFDTLGGVPRGGLGAVDAAGLVSAWAPEVGPGSVEALALRGATVSLGGSFSTVNGQPMSSSQGLHKKTHRVSCLVPVQCMIPILSHE